MVKVREFSDIGIARVRNFLEKVRTEKKSYSDEAASIINDEEYLVKASLPYEIDLDKVFTDKRSLVDYLLTVFPDDYLESSRTNVGLWTWLAMAYYRQFAIITKRGQMPAEARWIYNAEDWRDSRRHFIAGTMYLYRDISELGDEAEDMFMSAPAKEFSAILDSITLNKEVVQNPAFIQVLVWLYYDPTTKTRIKKGAKTALVREFTRVINQLKMTRDFFTKEDAQLLWDLLPDGFEKLKARKEG